MPSTDEFRHEIAAQIDRATKQGRPHIEINAGELHRVVGGYPTPTNRMAMCCGAMRELCRPDDHTIYEPPARDGASLTIRYKLPR